jgi:tetratricopeptide (TPR) repeat protein
MKDFVRRTLDVPTIAGLAATLILVIWVLDDGAYAPTTWYPGGLLVAGLLASIAAGLGSRLEVPDGLRLWALGAFAAYTLLSFASILWAEVPGDALEGANRTLLYLLAAVLWSVIPWTAEALRRVLVVFLLASGVIAIVTVLRVDATLAPDPFFVNARLSAPLGYQNASAALWLACALAAIVLASRAATPIALRVVLSGLVPLWIALGLMAQSRGWLVAVPVCALAVGVVVPGRLRYLLGMLPATAVAIAVGDALAVYDAGALSPGDVRSEQEAGRAIASAFDQAAPDLLLAVLAGAVIGAALALADRRTHVGESTLHLANRIAAGAAVVLVVVGAGLAFQRTDGDPVGKVSDALKEFRDFDEGTPGTDGSRFSSLGSSRADFWRVGMLLWQDKPVVGLGQDNFAAAYLQRARSNETPRWLHSLPLRLLVHTGFLGLVIFTGFLAALGGALWRVRSALEPEHQAIMAAALAPLAVWLIQGGQDWLWEFPVLTVLAVGTAMAAAGLRSGDDHEHRPTGGRAVRVLPAFAVLCAVIFIGPWLAARHADQASQLSARDPVAALEHLQRASDLNPLSGRAALTGGLIHASLGRREAAEAWLRESLERDPTSWLAHLDLGLLAGESDPEESRRRILEAKRRYPRAEVVLEALERLDTGKPMSVAEAHESLRASARQVTAR